MIIPQAYDPKAAVLAWRRNLPHYRQDHAVYYVTFRLADSVPAVKLNQWRQELEDLPPEEQGTHVARRMERWLDRGHGSCLLERPGTAELVEQSLLNRDTTNYLLDEYVVMPNHVHLLVMPLPPQELSKIAQAWKSYTAHQINQHLSRHGPVWQIEPFDHIVRDRAALDRFRKYIRGNPAKLPEHRAISGHGRFAEQTGL